MSDATYLHNKVAADAMNAIVRPMIDAGYDDAAIMVALESAVLGVLLANERAFRVSRAATAMRLDSLANAVAERLGGLS